MSSSSPASNDAAARALMLRHVQSLIAKTSTFFAQHQDAQLKLLRNHLFEAVDARPHTTAAQHLRDAAMVLNQHGSRFNTALQATVRQAIEDDFDALLPGSLGALRPQAAEPESESPVSMALLDVDEIERHLLVDRVAQRFNQRYEAQLKPFTQTLGALLRLEEFSLADNPFRPAMLVRAFALAWGRCEFDPAIAEDFVSVMDPSHCADWKPLYASLNESLVRAGFAARTVHRIKRAPGHDSGNAPLQSGYAPLDSGARASTLSTLSPFESRLPTAPSGVGEGGSAGGLVAAGRGIATRARQFLQKLGFGEGGDGAGGMGAGQDGSGGRGSGGDASLSSHSRMPADSGLMGFLGRLQINAGALPGSSLLPDWLADMGDGDRNVLRRMREREEVQRAPEIERGTIDALAEVFDYVFADKAIPMQLKYVIGRLQIPVLKAAMLDRDFFLSPEHPARQLVDALAAASVGWTPEMGEADPLFVRIDGTVKRVLAEFRNDLALFGLLLEDFKAFIREHQQQVDIRIEPTADYERGHEAHALALAHVDEVIHQSISVLPAHEPLQPFLMPFLTTQWREVMARAWVQRASQPDTWDPCLRTMDELIWSTQPKTSPPDRAKLMALLPDLVARLNASMDAIAWDGEARAHFTRRLIDTHMKAIRPPRPATVPTAALITAATTTTPAMQPSAAPGTGPDSSPGELEASAGREALQALDARRAEQQQAQTKDVDDFDGQAAALTRGQWFDYLDDDGRARHYRLGWVSPRRTRMLFTNRDGFEAFVRSEREVAQLLREARLIVLEHEPIVGRAIDHLMAGAEDKTADLELV